LKRKSALVQIVERAMGKTANTSSPGSDGSEFLEGSGDVFQ
jgi:hypothetical protein